MADTSSDPAPDLLHGVGAIAEHLKMTRPQVYHLHNRRELPTFKMGRTVCALRSKLAEHFAERSMATARHG